LFTNGLDCAGDFYNAALSSPVSTGIEAVTENFHPRRSVFLLGSLSAFGALSIDMYLPSLPTLQQHFQVNQFAIQLTLAA